MKNLIMKKKLLVILSLTALSNLTACDFFMGKKTTEAPVIVTPAFEEEATLKKGPANMDCKDSGFSNAESKAVFKMKNGVEFVLCEAFELTQGSADSYTGWGNLYQRKDKLFAVLLDVKSEKPKDVYSFTFNKKSEEEIIILRQVMSTQREAGGDDLVVTERKIICTKPNECEIGKEKCIDFKKTLKADKKAIARVQDVMSGKTKIEDAGYYDVTIGELVTSALAGDSTAKKLMLDTTEAKLKIDGAAAETYYDGKNMLLKLRELKCL